MLSLRGLYTAICHISDVLKKIWNSS